MASAPHDQSTYTFLNTYHLKPDSFGGTNATLYFRAFNLRVCDL